MRPIRPHIHTVIHKYMNPEIYTSEDILLIESLFIRFRTVITEDEGLYGFILNEYDEVVEKFPNIDLLDEGANDYDHSSIVLNNLFAFMLDNNPTKTLNTEEIVLVQLLWEKLKNAKIKGAASLI